MRNIIGQDDIGEFKIVVPDNAVLTYGPNVPFARKDNVNYSRTEGYALRVYNEKKEIQATFTNVKWFRDENIKIYRVVERESGQTLWKSNEDGYEVTTRANKTREMIDVSRQLNGAVVTPKLKKGKK